MAGLGSRKFKRLKPLTKVKPAFRDMADVRAANKALGRHFFDAKTMKFFGSKIESGLLKNRYFITSEQPPHGPREFKVREAIGNGEIQTWSIGPREMVYGTKAKASAAVKEFGTRLT